jgi:hypothetical protein
MAPRGLPIVLALAIATPLRPTKRCRWTCRLIGSIRRECLDHVVVFGKCHLRHVLLSTTDSGISTSTPTTVASAAPELRSEQADGGWRQQARRSCRHYQRRGDRDHYAMPCQQWTGRPRIISQGNCHFRFSGVASR